MMVTINERIREVRAQYCKGKNKMFADALNKQPNTTSNWCRDGYSVGNGVVQEIAETFGVSAEWLLTGKGNMTKEDPVSNPTVDEYLRIIASQQETIARLAAVIERLTAAQKGEQELPATKDLLSA